MLGADAETRRAVRDALRTGRARDARVDALARDAAERSTGTLHTQQIMFGVLAGVWVVLLGLRLAGGDLGETALTSVTLALFGGIWVVTTRQRRRSLRYLREGRPAGHDDRAA